MVTLPVSGLDMVLRDPDGVDDLLIHEAGGGAIEAAVTVIQRLGRPATGGTLDATGLVVTDFDALLLHLRTARFGPKMRLGFVCPHCRAVAEIGFDIRDLLASATPRPVPGVNPDPGRAGWFLLDGAGFRLPQIADLTDLADPARHLASRCLDPAARAPQNRPRIERAMAVMAPEVSRSIAGACPGCGVIVRAGFSAARVVVTEMKRMAAGVHAEVDAIARAYHWPESHILALPQVRRRAYAERIRASHARAA